MTVRFKICCIASEAEARMAVAAGANAIGLVSEMPSGPGVIDEVSIARIAATVPPGVATVLLTSKQTAAEIVDQQRRTSVDTVQICDALPPGAHAEIRSALPGVRLIQVIHVTGPESVDEAQEAAAAVDALLLDSGNPALAVKQLGGTGRIHNWNLSGRIVDTAGIPVFLAGGLNPGNVGEAIARVRPYAVDVCSGLRRDGALQGDRLAAFATAIQAALPV